MATEVKEGRRLVYLPLSSLVCTPTIHNTKKRRRALRALFPAAKSLKLPAQQKDASDSYRRRIKVL